MTYLYDSLKMNREIDQLGGDRRKPAHVHTFGNAIPIEGRKCCTLLIWLSAVMPTLAPTAAAPSDDLLPVEPAEIADLLLVTCIRYDPVLLEEHGWHSTKSGGDSKSSYLLLPFHVQRLRAAAEAFGWSDAIDLLSRDDAQQWFQNQCESALARAGAIPHPLGDQSAYKVSPSGFKVAYLIHHLTRRTSFVVCSDRMATSRSASNLPALDHSISSGPRT
jgi:hypothetical protein